MTYTLADAIRAQFERDHPNGKNTLFCADGCRRVKDRLDFREQPWHGRAARCLDCEGDRYRPGGVWGRMQDERVRWELEQAREKLRMWQRYAYVLRTERYLTAPQRFALGAGPTSGQYIEARRGPWERAVEARRRKWAAALEEALSKALTLSQEDS